MSRIKSSEINRENLDWLLKQPLEVKIEMMSQHLEICRIVINSILQVEVEELAGKRYHHVKPNGGRYSRWGSNPGSVKIGDQKLRVCVPRVMDNDQEKNVSLESYKALQSLPDQDESLVASVLHGLSTRDYGQVTEQLFDSFGLSASSISRRFKEQSQKALELFEKRKFDSHSFVALYVDGKYLSDQQMVVAMGVTDQGKKLVLGLIQTATENSLSISQLFRDIVQRGFSYDGGLLCIIDGAKGIAKAVREVFGKEAVIQRCQWHKRENVVSYLPEKDQKTFRSRLQKAYRESDYKEAKKQLQDIHADLQKLNRSAANSLKEGLEETLTIQRLGMLDWFGKCFTTTNCIESLNSAIEKYTRKIKRWVNSDQRYRWVCMAAITHETKMRKVDNFKKLHLLKAALKNEVDKRKGALNENLGNFEKISTKKAT